MIIKVTLDIWAVREMAAQYVREKFKSLAGQGQYLEVRFDDGSPQPVTVTIEPKYTSSD